MDALHNPFKQALKSGRLQIGLWHSLSSHLVVEILADSGFDWILLDTEHAPNELPMVLAQLQAMRGGTAHAVVRPAWNDAVIIKRLLDIGAQSLLIPYVETEEEAHRAVISTRYPPRGLSRLRLAGARVALWQDQGLPRGGQRRDLPARAGRDEART